MQYRFHISVFSELTGLLFSTEINADSVQSVANYYLGGYHIEELDNGKEVKTRMTRIEIHSQIPLTEG
jgi:hypothetical protein